MKTTKPVTPDAPRRESQTLSRKELALLIFPGHSPQTASQMLSRWIARDDDLRRDLERAHYQKRQRIIIPCQVRIFFDHFGL